MAEASIGWVAALRNNLRDAGELYRLSLRTAYYIFRGKREPGAIAKQMYSIGNQSLFFMMVTMGFLGAIVVYQSGLQAQRLVPDYSILGATYIKLLVREFAPSVGALPLATRVGAGIAAEIGSMVVTEQTDALRMSGADPVDYLVVPRFVACVVMGVVILALGGFAAYSTGALVAYVNFDVSPNTFTNLMWVEMRDVIVGLIKCVFYGGAIAIVSAQRGLATFGGSEGVGQATTEAVVGSSFAIIVLNLIISAIDFLIP